MCIRVCAYLRKDGNLDTMLYSNLDTTFYSNVDTTFHSGFFFFFPLAFCLELSPSHYFLAMVFTTVWNPWLALYSLTFQQS